MQLVGERFTNASALFGNDLATLPEFPAEIRAPGRGRWPASPHSRCRCPITTSPRHGDSPNVLVAMNPAAMKSELHRFSKVGGTIIVNTDTFEDRNLSKAGYDAQPARGPATLDNYTVFDRADDRASPKRCVRTSRG